MAPSPLERQRVRLFNAYFYALKEAFHINVKNIKNLNTYII